MDCKIYRVSFDAHTANIDSNGVVENSGCLTVNAKSITDALIMADNYLKINWEVYNIVSIVEEVLDAYKF